MKLPFMFSNVRIPPALFFEIRMDFDVLREKYFVILYLSKPDSQASNQPHTDIENSLNRICT